MIINSCAAGSLIIWNGQTDQWEEGKWVNPYTRYSCCPVVDCEIKKETVILNK
jgi:hypothetical protein